MFNNKNKNSKTTTKTKTFNNKNWGERGRELYKSYFPRFFIFYLLINPSVEKLVSVAVFNQMIRLRLALSVVNFINIVSCQQDVSRTITLNL